MNFTDETVMAYVDGELEPETRAALEATMATDADLVRRVASCRALTARLRGAFEPVMREPVPEALIAAARKAPPAGATVTSIESARAAPPTRQYRMERMRAPRCARWERPQDPLQVPAGECAGVREP